MWQSADPILGKYLPTGDQSDLADRQPLMLPGVVSTFAEHLPNGGRDKNRHLAGMGGSYNPINLALYTYSHHNPVRFSDPDGREVLGADEGRKKYGGGTKGHHWVPFGSLSDLDVSSEARAYFGQTTSGESLPSEVHLKGHGEYNKAVRENLVDYAERNNIDLSKMTTDEAKGFMSEVRESKDPRIANTRARIERFHGLPSGSRTLFRFMSGVGAGALVEMTMPSPQRAPQCQMNPDGDGC